MITLKYPLYQWQNTGFVLSEFVIHSSQCAVTYLFQQDYDDLRKTGKLQFSSASTGHIDIYLWKTRKDDANEIQIVLEE